MTPEDADDVPCFWDVAITNDRRDLTFLGPRWPFSLTAQVRAQLGFSKSPGGGSLGVAEMVKLARFFSEVVAPFFGGPALL